MRRLPSDSKPFYDSRLDLFQLLQHPLQLVLKVVVAMDAEVFANTAAIGSDGLVVGDAVELKQFYGDYHHDGEDNSDDGLFLHVLSNLQNAILNSMQS